MKLDRDQVLELLPHRTPFLLVDEVIDGDPGDRAVAVRHLREDDWWFAGHFPGNPVMPGVLIVEAMAQTATIAVRSGDEPDGRIGLFAGIDKVRFKRVVKPGETLTCEAWITAKRDPIGRAKVEARVGDQLVARGELMFAIVDATAVAEGRASL